MAGEADAEVQANATDILNLGEQYGALAGQEAATTGQLKPETAQTILQLNTLTGGKMPDLLASRKPPGQSQPRGMTADMTDEQAAKFLPASTWSNGRSFCKT